MAILEDPCPLLAHRDGYVVGAHRCLRQPAVVDWGPELKVAARLPLLWNELACAHMKHSSQVSVV